MADLRAFPDILDRKQAAAYLTSLGYKITPKTLANRVVTGGGPPFTRRGWNLVTYARVDLDLWLRAQLVRIEPTERPASSRVVPRNPA